MDMRALAAIARQEFMINVRNRWTVIFAIVFGALVVSVSYAGIMAEGFAGMQNFTRTSASLLNLVLYVVPLVALIMGTIAFTGDKGSTELLFSQPVSRGVVVGGKLLGVFGSIALSTLIGFSIAGVMIVSDQGTAGLARYAAFVIMSLLLSLAFLSLSLLIATAGRRKSRVFGIALFLWFFFVVFYDLAALAGTLLLKGETANTALFLSLFGNPVDMVRVASLIALDDVAIFGAAGAALIRFLGGGALSIALLVAGLAAWIVIPLVAAGRMLRRQDI
jgi:Cu-processing system permease protein